MSEQALFWQKASPLDDEENSHKKDHSINIEAGTPQGDEDSKTFDEGWAFYLALLCECPASMCHPVLSGSGIHDRSLKGPPDML